MFWHDRCVACSGIGAFLNLEGACTCPAFAEFNEDDGVCSCGEGYLIYNDKTCISCSGVGATLTDAGICTCGINAMLDLVDGRLQCVCPQPFFYESNTETDRCFYCKNGTFNFKTFLELRLPICFKNYTDGFKTVYIKTV